MLGCTHDYTRTHARMQRLNTFGTHTHTLRTRTQRHARMKLTFSLISRQPIVLADSSIEALTAPIRKQQPLLWELETTFFNLL